MDQYQNYLYERISIYPNRDSENRLSDFQNGKNKIILTQNENYNITKYTIFIASVAISKVEYLVGKKYMQVLANEPYTYALELDFAKKAKEVKIHFKYDVADPIIIPIEYIEADKEKYDAKVAEEHKKELKAKANVRVNTGDSIITVTFKSVSEQYAFSEVELHTITKISPNEYQFMAKYKINEGVYFHSMPQLAYGSYAVVLIQYDKEGKELYRSDYISVFLEKPSSKPTDSPHSKPTVRPHY